MWQTEGDAYFRRNHLAMHDPALIETDIPLKLIDLYGLQPRVVVEVGCSNAWRLFAFWQKYGTKCVGVDASLAAIEDGQFHYPELQLSQAMATALPIGTNCADLAIVAFLFHWLPREDVDIASQEIDRVLAPGGYLILSDFAPDDEVKVPYHHRQGIWTYKWSDAYRGEFVEMGYLEIARLTFDHDAHAISSNVASGRRAACSLLKKGDV